MSVLGDSARRIESKGPPWASLRAVIRSIS